MIRLWDNFEEDQKIKEEIADDIVYDGHADLVLHKKVLFNNFEKIKKFVQLLSHDGKIRLIIDGNVNEANSNDSPYIFTKEETQKLIELNNSISKTGEAKIFFCDQFVFDNSLTSYLEAYLLNLNQVIEANQNLDAVVDKIKSLKLSPYETMLYIHEYVANIVDSGIRDWLDLNRNNTATFIGAYNGKGLVCAGRSSLTKAIIDKLNMPGLSCEYVVCSIHSNPKLERIKEYEEAIMDRPELKKSLEQYKKFGDIGRHRLCLVKIIDEKYKISGDYLDDAHWDKMKKSFAFCCYPVGDVLNFRAKNFIQTKLDTFQKKERLDDWVKEVFKLAKKLKNGKYVPDVVQKHGQNSKPITRPTFESALKNLYLKIYEGNEEKAKAEIQEQTENSINVAKQVFTENASNCFLKQTEKSIGNR